MNLLIKITRKVNLLMASFAFLAAGCSTNPPFQDVAGASSEMPLHCPETDCSVDRDLVTATGDVVDPGTGRKFFIDYPSDLRPGEDVTVILSLHGGGSYGNWQRHYFPIMDVKDKYRLVIATPNSPVQVWREEDDQHLHNVVDTLIAELGESNIRSFWLAGHSQGGMTSRRIVCTPYFRDKVDGFLSLSGGRVGGTAAISPNFFPRTRDENGEVVTQNFGAGLPPAPPEPDCDFSHIYATGEHEIQALPDVSAWARKYNCGARRTEEVVDTRPGYVYDPTRQDPGSIGWGRLPRPGTAEVHVYPDCDDGRIVADVVRLEKGHTEGLEPAIVDKLGELMASVRR